MNRLIDVIFFCSSVIFNISVGVLYVAAKLGSMVLLQLVGAIVLSLIIPFTITLLGYMKEKEKKTIVSHLFILFYLFLELLLEYILKIPFREILAIHVIYIIVFYVALFSMISVTFERNKKEVLHCNGDLFDVDGMSDVLSFTLLMRTRKTKSRS